MSQSYLGHCKPFYSPLNVWRWIYVTIKECISSGKEGSVWAMSNLPKHTWSKGPMSNSHDSKYCVRYLYLKSSEMLSTFLGPLNISPTTVQLTQWRQFEEDQNNLNQLAKYFSSPSKSQPSVYSQDEVYYLLGENDSIKKLLTEVKYIKYTVKSEGPHGILKRFRINPALSFFWMLWFRFVFYFAVTDPCQPSW